eukprot:TRINITY_DN571_c0_g1_i14.p1 TRINITY_DN571_c0_g1~~TRINITY_DN571_c0_g1_i14.p1  ORF type:complete len:120 (-),score=18.02 TRINITY_DN571_c0_g1_i14:39-398(-)
MCAVDPWLGTHRSIAFDNFFCSLGLHQKLYENKTHSCSTCRRNCRSIPASFRSPKRNSPGRMTKAPQQLQLREGQWMMQQGHLIRWMDSREVFFMSTLPLGDESPFFEYLKQQRKWGVP